MTFDEFKDEVRRILTASGDMVQLSDAVPTAPERARSWWGQTQDDEKLDCLCVSWETGGVKGGSCWGMEKCSYTTSEKPDGLTSMEAVLEALHPSMTYLAFRRLERLVVQGSYVSPEHYNNETYYTYQYIPLQSLYDFLLAEGACPSPSVT